MPDMEMVSKRSRTKPATTINVVAVLEILRYLDDHEGEGDVRIPGLLDMLRDSGHAMSRATITRLLADAEVQLGVQIVYDGVGSIGGYRIASWGLLDRAAVMESFPRAP